jgi:hypothetical protein
LDKHLEYPQKTFLEPFSTQSEPFTEWLGQPFSFLKDGFCHEKFFKAKVSSVNSRSAIKID